MGHFPGEWSKVPFRMGRDTAREVRLFGIGSTELLVILVIAVLVFGAKRLPEIGAGMGKAIRDFRKAASGSSEVESGEPGAKRIDKSE